MKEQQTQGRLSRRAFLRVGAGVAGMAALAACVPPSPGAQQGNAGAASGPVDLDIWTGWTEDAATNIEKILDGYNKSQNQVKAHHVVVPEAMTQKLLAAISAGNPPGGAIVFGASIAYQLAAQKAVLALDEVGKPDQVATLKKWMNPAIWELGMYEGKYVYASMWNQCMGVFVNNKIAAQQGVDVKNPPKTLEELDATWDKLTIWKGDNIDVLGGDFTWTSMIMGRFLGQYVSEDGTKVTANHPNNLKALEWIAGRWKRIGPQKLQDFYASLQGRGERSAGNDPFLSGLRATDVTGPWEFNTLRNFKPEGFEFTVWPLPSPEGQSKKGMYTYGDGWIIPKGSKDPASTWEIISAMTGATGNRDVYTSLFTTWLCVNGPVSEEMTQWPKFKSDVMGACPGYADVFLQDLFHADQYLYPPKIPTSDSYSSLMNAEWEKVRLGQKGAQEALDGVQQQAQKELDDWRSKSKS
ncbi:MAG: substrate-binding domain-containing protein [Caldilineaceae bacterium]